jgi:glutamyl-tRNA synthetase
MSSPAFKTRFAPSPTGLLHLGNVRTALFNWLAARRAGGTFLLRIEDTDAMRGHEKYAEALKRDLRWLGLDWGEGPEVGGTKAPYAQSERGHIYAEYFASLEGRGLAYPCFCSEHELEISRKTQIAAGRPPRYSGKCRPLTPTDVAERRSRGLPSTLRFRVPEGKRVTFEDKVRGRQEFSTDDIGDFVIRRSDGTPAFFFCNAIDDALMQVSLVLRGEDHLTNTPRQILLLEALGLPVPEYAHIALVVGSDGAPLSKRTGSKSVEELRVAGYLPGAINNYLARLGHTYENDKYMTLEQLASEFDIGRLHRAPARFDEVQLLRWQKEAVRNADDEGLWNWMSSTGNVSSRGNIRHYVPDGQEYVFVRAVRNNIIMPGDSFEWAANLFAENGRHVQDAREVIGQTDPGLFETALAHLDLASGNFGAFVDTLKQVTGLKGKALYMPLRAALTGLTAVSSAHAPSVGHVFDWRNGPELDRLWQLLGPERVRYRLEAAVKLSRGGGS